MSGMRQAAKLAEEKRQRQKEARAAFTRKMIPVAYLFSVVTVTYFVLAFTGVLPEEMRIAAMERALGREDNRVDEAQSAFMMIDPKDLAALAVFADAWNGTPAADLARNLIKEHEEDVWAMVQDADGPSVALDYITEFPVGSLLDDGRSGDMEAMLTEHAAAMAEVDDIVDRTLGDEAFEDGEALFEDSIAAIAAGEGDGLLSNGAGELELTLGEDLFDNIAALQASGLADLLRPDAADPDAEISRMDIEAYVAAAAGFRLSDLSAFGGALPDPRRPVRDVTEVVGRANAAVLLKDREPRDFRTHYVATQSSANKRFEHFIGVLGVTLKDPNIERFDEQRMNDYAQLAFDPFSVLNGSSALSIGWFQRNTAPNTLYADAMRFYRDGSVPRSKIYFRAVAAAFPDAMEATAARAMMVDVNLTLGAFDEAIDSLVVLAAQPDDSGLARRALPALVTQLSGTDQSMTRACGLLTRLMEPDSEFDVRVAETARDLLAEIQCSDSSAISPEEMPEQPVSIEPVSLRIDPAPPLRAE
ncbi:MAG: hypothetical protein AAFQ21_03055 [Pseudomonadota bacterium]